MIGSTDAFPLLRISVVFSTTSSSINEASHIKKSFIRIWSTACPFSMASAAYRIDQLKAYVPAAIKVIRITEIFSSVKHEYLYNNLSSSV